jgi:hypothetical protein
VRLRGLLLYTCFEILMGFKRRMKAIGKTTSFTFRKESENVPFFEHVRLKFAKSAYMTNKIVVKN